MGVKSKRKIEGPKNIVLYLCFYLLVCHVSPNQIQNGVCPGFEIPASPVARGDQFLLRTTLILELSSPPGECKIKKSKYVNFPELYLEQFCILLHLFIYSLKKI